MNISEGIDPLRLLRLRGNCTAHDIIDDVSSKLASSSDASETMLLDWRVQDLRYAVISLATIVGRMREELDAKAEERKTPLNTSTSEFVRMRTLRCGRSVLRDSSCVLGAGHDGLHKDRDGYQVDDQGVEPWMRRKKCNDGFHALQSPADRSCACGALTKRGYVPTHDEVMNHEAKRVAFGG